MQNEIVTLKAEEDEIIRLTKKEDLVEVASKEVEKVDALEQYRRR